MENLSSDSLSGANQKEIEVNRKNSFKETEIVVNTHY